MFLLQEWLNYDCQQCHTQFGCVWNQASGENPFGGQWSGNSYIIGDTYKLMKNDCCLADPRFHVMFNSQCLAKELARCKNCLLSVFPSMWVFFDIFCLRRWQQLGIIICENVDNYGHSFTSITVISILAFSVSLMTLSTLLIFYFSTSFQLWLISLSINACSRQTVSRHLFLHSRCFLIRKSPHQPLFQPFFGMFSFFSNENAVSSLSLS